MIFCDQDESDIDNLLENGSESGLFVDSEFPPVVSSIFFSERQETEDDIEWKRPHVSPKNYIIICLFNYPII